MTDSALPGESGTRPLASRKIVVTRAEPGRLDAHLRTLGAVVVQAPTITFADPADGGRALRDASLRLQAGSYDWLVVTSATAVRRLADTLDAGMDLSLLRVAAVGPATAHAVAELGGDVDLVPPEAVGESLVEAFPTGVGRVLLLRPEVARDVVPAGVRRKGWLVDEVTAYRTVPTELDEATLIAVRRADVATFTSPSTVQHLVAAVGAEHLPPLVVSIGPVTSQALRGHGIVPDAEASPHTVEGLVAAVCAAVSAVE